MDNSGVSFYVHRRDGNQKRNFVLVSRDLAKHYPCNAVHTINMCNQLAERGFNSTGRHGDIMVIAFAETATALGIIAASRLKELNPRNDVFLVTTTREALGAGFCTLEFQEKHSHAASQVMYFGDEIKEKLDGCTRLVIIDDELSTGSTALNLVDSIEEKYRINEFTSVEVWSLLNGMGDRDRQRYKSRGIKLVYLEEVNKTAVEKHAATLDTGVKIAAAGNQKPVITTTSVELTSGDVRYGVDVLKYTNELKSQLGSVARNIKRKGYSAVDVIGTEECIYPAVLLAGFLTRRFPDTKVTCHSTTRSPIVAGNGTLLSDRASLASLYDSGRVTYIYNMAGKPGNTLAVVVTDAVCSTGAKEQFAFALGNSAGRVEFIDIKYGTAVSKSAWQESNAG